MIQTTDRLLPLTRDVLDRYWMPPESDTDVSRLTARHGELSARRTQIADALASLHAADVAAIVAAIVDADDLDHALTALDPSTVTVTLLERQAAVLTDAANAVRSRLDHAARTDPVYLAWRQECQTILTDWITPLRRDPASDEPEAERRRRLEMFAHRRGG